MLLLDLGILCGVGARNRPSLSYIYRLIFRDGKRDLHIGHISAWAEVAFGVVYGNDSGPLEIFRLVKRDCTSAIVSEITSRAPHTKSDPGMRRTIGAEVRAAILPVSR